MKILKADNNKANIRFLFYLMQTIKIDNEQHKRYWISKYSKLKVKIPPLPEQKRITYLLDQADKLRQLNKQLIAKYDELTQSLFLEMFGNPITNPKKIKTLKGKNIFRFSSGKYNPTKNLSDDYEFPTYGGNGITGYSEKYLLNYQTIIIGRVGAYCGSIHKTKGKVWITDNAIYIKEFKTEINLTYVYFFYERIQIK